MDLYRRLRHSYGFGVHSPRAYRLVKEVWIPDRRLRWYGYAEIEHALELWWRTPEKGASGAKSYRSQHPLRRDARLLLRLAAFTGIKSVWLTPSFPSPLKAALLAADSRMRILTGSSHAGADMLVAIGLSSEKEKKQISDYLKATPSGRVLILRNAPEELSRIAEEAESGVMLRGLSRTFIERHPDNPLHIYDVI